MRIAYFDCASGISGDMTLAALVDAGADLAAIQAGIDSLGLPGCRLATSEVKKRSFRALRLAVTHEPEQAHRHLRDIAAMMESGKLTPRAKQTATRIFQKLAEAEAKVHGTTVDKVHFHEVGAVDSIADIVGTAIALDVLDIERIACSPVPTGHGCVEIDHGRLSIPAPATAELLRGVPLAPLDVEGELTTPTGAAILAALATSFGPPPAMTIDRIGYGAGQRDFEHPNILRVLVGEATETSEGQESNSSRPRIESIIVLETNLDDCPGDVVAHAVERLWAAGALDVAVTPIQMKKGRPGVALSVQAAPADADALEKILFRETTTLGVRRTATTRTVLARRLHTVETPWGPIVGKAAHLPDGTSRFAPEYEACHSVSVANDVPLSDVLAAARRAFRPGE
jgi:uncharacterized protein (TIGR00299 family) protein